MVLILIQTKVQQKLANNYVHHALRSGARTVSANKEGKRECCAWEFHCAGWDNTDKQNRRGDTTSNILPKEMRSKLDEDILTTLGLTDHEM